MPHEPDLDRSYEAMSWDGAHLNVLRAGARMSLAEKLRWLQEAHHLVEHLEKSRAERIKRSSAKP